MIPGNAHAKLQCCKSILGQDIELTAEEVEKVIEFNRNYWDGWSANRVAENVIHKELKFLTKRQQGYVMGILRSHNLVYDPRDKDEYLARKAKE
jgi:hypothetical protein